MTSPPPQSSTALRIAMPLVVSAVFLVLVEVGLRLFIPHESLLLAFEKPDPSMFLEQKAGGSTLRMPGRSEQRVDGGYPWTWRTNEQGLREDEEIQTTSSCWRMLGLGDSWMFGVNANQGRTLPDVIEDLLPQRLGERCVEVINLGVPGGSAFDMLARWRQYSSLYEVDALLFTTPHNVNRQQQVAGDRSDWYAAAQPYPASGLWMYLGVRKLVSHYAGQYSRRFSVRVLPEGDPMDQAIVDLKLMADEAGFKGLDVWHLALPADYGETGGEADRWFGAPIARAMEGHVTATISHVLAERSCWGFADTHHPSESGYRVLGEVVVDLIATRQVPGGPLYNPSCASVRASGPGKSWGMAGP